MYSDSEHLSLALAAARLGDWSWDADTDIVTFSERAAAVFQIPPGPHMTRTKLRDLVHPDDAEACGIQDGASCRISSAHGSIELPARVTDEVKQGTIAVPHGWGHRGGWRLAAIAAERPEVALWVADGELAAAVALLGQLADDLRWGVHDACVEGVHLVGHGVGAEGSGLAVPLGVGFVGAEHDPTAGGPVQLGVGHLTLVLEP